MRGDARALRAFAVMLLGAAVASCGRAHVANGRVAGLTAIVAKAEQSGAARCAPRELALAKSHLRFAAVDLDQGELAEAEAHLDVADPNAHAALSLSPADKCAVGIGREGDRDGDGIADARDRCPDERETYNGYLDEDGCPDDPDTDGDTVADSRDACLLAPEDRDGYLDDDGCPEPDDDLDRIADAADKCPREPEDPDGFEDEDGCPDDDNDDDTVADVYDECPSTPGQPSGERPGCPDLVVVTAKEIRITQQIQFAFNKANIKPESYPTLDAVVDVLRRNPKIRIEVQGHTDNVGRAAYNLKLSQRRADAVKKYLVAHGVDSARLVAKGYGMTRPLVPNSSPKNRALNRRVQFIRTEAAGD